MNRKRLYILVAVLIIASLAFIVAGLSSASTVLWGFGLAVIALAMLLSFISRWVR